MNLPPIDVPPARAAATWRRARRVFEREAALARAPWPLRAEAAFGRVVEPWLAGAGAAAMLVWAVTAAFGG